MSSMGPAWLFCPADRPERYGKAAERADVVILDLEDAVAQDTKHQARQWVGESALDPARTLVRVNAADSPHFAEDLAMVRTSGYTQVMLPKAEDPRVLTELEGLRVYTLIETARGVLAAEDLAAHPAVHGLMWGAEDLVASLGGTSSRRADGGYRQVAVHARARVLLAARAWDKQALDSVYLDIPDLAGLAAEAEDAQASGFTAKVLIHPSHVPVVREAFAGTQRRQWAQRVLQAAQNERGVFSFEGQMVDEPVLRQARQILERD